MNKWEESFNEARIIIFILGLFLLWGLVIIISYGEFNLILMNIFSILLFFSSVLCSFLVDSKNNPKILYIGLILYIGFLASIFIFSDISHEIGNFNSNIFISISLMFLTFLKLYNYIPDLFSHVNSILKFSSSLNFVGIYCLLFGTFQFIFYLIMIRNYKKELEELLIKAKVAEKKEKWAEAGGYYNRGFECQKKIGDFKKSEFLKYKSIELGNKVGIKYPELIKSQSKERFLVYIGLYIIIFGIILSVGFPVLKGRALIIEDLVNNIFNTITYTIFYILTFGILFLIFSIILFLKKRHYNQKAEPIQVTNTSIETKEGLITKRQSRTHLVLIGTGIGILSAFVILFISNIINITTGNIFFIFFPIFLTSIGLIFYGIIRKVNEDIKSAKELEKVKDKVKKILLKKVEDETTFEEIAFKSNIDNQLAKRIVINFLISGIFNGKISGDKVILIRNE